MKRILQRFIVLTTFSMTGCFMGAGTHGSIKGYRYSITKDKLETAVMAIIKSNPNIHRDTIKNYMIDITNGKHDTIINDYYNDGKKYVTISIRDADIENKYTFRYIGDENNWKSSASSEIFICYAYTEDGKGGCEGYHSFRFKQGLKKKLIDLFEREFVSKVDKELDLSHTETE
jgi:hypothetical protein